MRVRRQFGLIACLGIAAFAGSSSLAGGGAQSWPQWRGPGRDGRAPGFRAPARWPAKLARKWSLAVGEGHASPVVADGAVFLHSRQGEQEVVRRVDLRTGRESWKSSIAVPYDMNPAARGHGKGPKATPCYAAGKLYTLGIDGTLQCLYARTGSRRWRRTFGREFRATSPLYGAASSPLVEGGLLIAQVGGHDSGALAAFDADTGRDRWQWTGDGPGYSSPVIAELGGVRQVVTQTQRACVGVDAATGKLLWRIPFTTPYDQNCVTPVVVGDLVVFGGTQQPTRACRVRRRPGNSWQVDTAWETREVTLYMSTPVAVGTRLIGLSERRSGQLFTLDGGTGKTLWSGEGRFAENASVLEAGGVLLVLGTDGDLRVYRRDGAGLVEAARYSVGESATWAAPALAGRMLAVKDAGKLHLWEIPGASAP